MPSRRRSASCSPSTASPSRLRFSRAPPSRIFASAGPSFSGRASTMRWPTISRSTRRAIGTTGLGSTGATAPPVRTAARRYQGRNSGTSGAMRCRFAAAAPSASGRITPSTNPSVKGRPWGSLSTPASLRGGVGMHLGCFADPALGESDRALRPFSGSRVGYGDVVGHGSRLHRPRANAMRRAQVPEKLRRRSVPGAAVSPRCRGQSQLLGADAFVEGSAAPAAQSAIQSGSGGRSSGVPRAANSSSVFTTPPLLRRNRARTIISA